MNCLDGRNSPMFVPDYSGYSRGCDNCGISFSQLPQQMLPMPCSFCSCAHFCSPKCFLNAARTTHRAQCILNQDTELDFSGASTSTSGQALLDLRRFTNRWHSELGDAVVAALDLHSNSSRMEDYALVVHLSYIPHQPYRMRRFRFSHTKVEPIAGLMGHTLNNAITRRAHNSAVNQMNGMLGCALIVLACVVPGSGFVFNSTFCGPEPSAIADPPPQDWENRLRQILGVKESA